MTTAIPSPNPVLVALEQRALQPGGLAGATVDGAATPSLVPTDFASDPGAGTDTFSLSGGAAAALLNGVSGGLADAASAADAATSAGGIILGLLGDLRSTAQAAADSGLTTDRRAALDASFKSDLAQIGQAVAAGSVGGLNLIDGSAVGSPSLEGGAATLTPTNLSVGGPIIGLSSDAALSDPATAAGIADQLGQAIDKAGQALGQIASQGQAIESHLSLVSQALSALSPGVSGAISVGLDGDGARLQALQVQQQLAGGGSGLANQAPQAILALFQ